MGQPLENILSFHEIGKRATDRWPGRVETREEASRLAVTLGVAPELLPETCTWLFTQQGYRFATLVVEEQAPNWSLRYVFYGPVGGGQVHVVTAFPLERMRCPSVSPGVHAADWQEREAEDLFGLTFEGHPRLGDFVLHEQWPEGVNPMRASFNAETPYREREKAPEWRPNRILHAEGAFMMPIGPVFSGHAESAHFLLESVGEDVAHTIPRFFYKYRGVEKIAEGQTPDRVLLLAERFSGSSAFAHSLAFCQAVEEIAGVVAPMRARALRMVLAELERVRHHVAAIAGICASTALSVAAAQAHILEEELLRLTGRLTGHRYLFGLNLPGGLNRDFSDSDLAAVSAQLEEVQGRLAALFDKLRFTSSFLDRLEAVGTVSREAALTYGLVGPVARASGVASDLRQSQPYAGYDLNFQVPSEEEGDGYARLRILFREVEQSVALCRQVATALPKGAILAEVRPKAGAALGWVEAPRGAAFHWVRLDARGRVTRYRILPPSFVNWHGFHLAAEDFAFQDFPIIMATFGLSNAECDR